MNSADGEMHSFVRPRGRGCVVSEDGHLRFAVSSAHLAKNDASLADGVGLTLTMKELVTKPTAYWICQGCCDKVATQLAGSCPVEVLIRNLG